MHRVTLAVLTCLVLAGWIGIGNGAEEKPAFPAIGDKTLVAWVCVGDLKQGGGSALTIEDCSDLFDAIVSRGNQITIYRNAKEYVSYPTGETLTFREGSFAARAGGDLIADARALRARLLADPQRPRYHFVSPEGVCHPFDPNGAIFWRGKYHLMYIVQHRGHCWGHATSVDLLHWRIHPLALVPGEGDNGIFSGGAFPDKTGRPTIIYHGVGAGNCIAAAKDEGLVEWKKLPTNPIVPSPKEGDPDYGKYRSWDPHGWREGDTYYAIFGGDTPTLFKSNDLTSWEFRGPFLADRRWINGGDASCPGCSRWPTTAPCGSRPSKRSSGCE